MIFKLRSGVTDVKVNHKWKYDTYECDGCEKDEETQEHLIHCKVISEMQKSSNENDELLYENVMNGKVEEQVKIAKQFMMKLEILEKIRETKS